MKTFEGRLVAEGLKVGIIVAQNMTLLSVLVLLLKVPHPIMTMYVLKYPKVLLPYLFSMVCQ